ncbi:hypothetical protein L7F22_057125, partial [Adiantum nelumboides]|nr:hypothetical protein [Adiantum nelumboides]
MQGLVIEVEVVKMKEQMEEVLNAALYAKEIVLDHAIQEGFMFMDSFQDTNDDVDVFDVDPYVYD